MFAEFTINPWGFTGIFAVLLAWSLAAFLFRAANRDKLTVLFANVLIVEGAVLITAGAGLVMLFNLQVTDNYYWAHHLADCLMLFIYPLFLAHALPQKFLRVLRRPAAQPVLAVFAFVVWAADYAMEFWLIAAMLTLMFTAAFGLAAHSVVIARTKLARRRAIMFAVAFGIRDLSWGFVYGTGALGLLRDDPASAMMISQLYVGSTLIYIPIVAYGILSVRLLNIQFQVRRSVQKGTLAAIFVALFFLISEGSASFLSEQFGSVAGLLGATLIVFLMSPLHRMSEWFSSQVVQVDEGQEYKAYRKLQMYAAAVEDSLAHGEIGPAQRSLLDRLCESLDVSSADARRIESDLGLKEQAAGG